MKPEYDREVRERLKALRMAMGEPTLEAIRRHGGRSVSATSEMLTGRHRPTPKSVTAFVRACLAYGREHGYAAPQETDVLFGLALPGYRHDGHDDLVERQDELHTLAAVIRDVAAQRGGTVLIEGPAGIGKTRLLARLRAEASRHGLQPLDAVGTRFGQAMAFEGVRQLLGRWIQQLPDDKVAELFADEAALARLPLAMAASGSRPPATAGSVIESLYWLVVRATQDSRKLLLLVDDVHWLDPESVTWLRYLSERIENIPVLVAAARRSDHASSGDDLAALARATVQVVRLRELSRDAVSDVVHQTFSPDAEAAFSDACHERSGGNPFYLVELLGEAKAMGLAPTADSVASIHALSPTQVTRSVGVRLQALGDTARGLAQAVAVLGGEASLPDAAHLAQLELQTALAHFGQLCHARILREGATLAFIHPLVRDAVYGGMTLPQRVDGHSRAARLLHDQHAAAEEVATHLLATLGTGDPWTVNVLRAAARDALHTGAAEAAARYLGRAIDEPPSPVLIATVRHEYGSALTLCRLPGAIAQFEAAYRDADDDMLKTAIAVALAKAYSHTDRLGDAVRLLEAATAASTSEQFRLRLQAELLLWALFWAEDPKRTQRSALLRDLAPGLAPVDTARRTLLTLYAWDLVLHGEARQLGLDAVDRVAAGGVPYTDPDWSFECPVIIGFVLMFSNQLADARRHFAGGVEQLNHAGWRGTHLAFVHAQVANVALRAGRLMDAEADARIAVRLSDRVGPRVASMWYSVGALLDVLLAKGAYTEAAHLAAQRQYGRADPDAFVVPQPNWVYGRLLLAQRQSEAGIAALRTAGRWLDARAIANPAFCPWRLDLADALRKTAPGEATQLATTAQRQSDQFGDELVRGRARRTLAAMRGGHEALDLLTESAEILQPSPNRVEYAKTLVDLGSALLREGRTTDGRKHLLTAIQLANECAAPAEANKAHRRLTATGTPALPTTSHQLTADEYRAARLNAIGLSDSEIAHRMVVHTSDVARHLAAACAKLRVDSRAELAALVTRPTETKSRP